MKDFNWTKWSAIAELVSSAAIVFTLVYLVIQTQQNTDALLAGTRQAALEMEIAYLRGGIDRVEIEDILGLPYPENPGNRYDETLFRQAIRNQIVLFRMRESQWLSYRAGVLDRDVWEPYRDILLQILEESEVSRIAWERYSPGMTPGFKEEIDRLRNR